MSGNLVESGWVITASVIISVMLTRLMITLAHRNGWVVKPKADRWSQTPTALFGGVAIAVSFAIGVALFLLRLHPVIAADVWGLLCGAVVIFVVGARDDAVPLNPLVKLIGQILAIMPFLVGAGLAFTSATFVLSIPLVIFWILGLTNAFNLLDNMDGLSAGSAAICAMSISAYSFLHNRPHIGMLAALVCASCIGFLYFNFRLRGPAKIFMGDCGSMVLGYLLSGLAVIAFCPSDPGPLANRMAQCLLPVLIMALPIFDTTLVTVIRKREHRPISQGGRDHSSHRLVYAGNTDKHAVLLLYVVSILGGAAALILGHNINPVAIVAAIVVEIGLLLRFGIVLNRYPGPKVIAPQPIVRAAVTENGHRPRAEVSGSREKRS